ncbi:MAG: type II toxin-antitoxin system prevent-host-death family antitoxin [Gammaproteobacteria bacterium]|nr:MAG: type II toxin-antitoxin system prevent-host-death family antitoxin [Pseudomonadota bacterium]PIE38807.1 MAG: type II toxin-antitoxin system prevent-host-death family antitoxin [Gammaproteobacteria bacterium]
MEATAEDLRFHSKKLIESVNRGEEVIITYKGKPCAKLVPYEENEESTQEHELFGMWKDKKETEDVNDYLNSLRRGRF